MPVSSVQGSVWDKVSQQNKMSGVEADVTRIGVYIIHIGVSMIYTGVCMIHVGVYIIHLYP